MVNGNFHLAGILTWQKFVDIRTLEFDAGWLDSGKKVKEEG